VRTGDLVKVVLPNEEKRLGYFVDKLHTGKLLVAVEEKDGFFPQVMFQHQVLLQATGPGILPVTFEWNRP